MDIGIDTNVGIVIEVEIGVIQLHTYTYVHSVFRINRAEKERTT